MKGTRPLDNDEIRLVSACFDGTYQVRNRGLFMLGVRTGGRISELLSLMIGDVYQNSAAVTDLLFERSIVKSSEVSRRAVPVNADGRHAIDETDFQNDDKAANLAVSDHRQIWAVFSIKVDDDGSDLTKILPYRWDKDLKTNIPVELAG
jgi:site-specific recombinase XerC